MKSMIKNLADYNHLNS